MEHADDGRFVEPHDHASGHCPGGRQAPWLAGQTALAKEIPISMNRNDGLFSSLRYDCDLDLAVLHIKDGIRHISLKEHSLILAIFRYRPSGIRAGEKDFKVEGPLPFSFHDDFRNPSGTWDVNVGQTSRLRPFPA
jgi:hypothetical protein